jgi:hypothetical protein
MSTASFLRKTHQNILHFINAIIIYFLPLDKKYKNIYI